MKSILNLAVLAMMVSPVVSFAQTGLGANAGVNPNQKGVCVKFVDAESEYQPSQKEIEVTTTKTQIKAVQYLPNKKLKIVTVERSELNKAELSAGAQILSVISIAPGIGAPMAAVAIATAMAAEVAREQAAAQDKN